MKPVMVQRPSHLPPQQYIPPQNVHYQSSYNPRTIAIQPQQTYIQTSPYQFQPSYHPQPAYSLAPHTVPYQGYMPHYEPVYVRPPHLTQQMPQYYPQYMAPSISITPVVHPRSDVDVKSIYDYESASSFPDSSVVQNTVFCVICGHNFKTSQKDEHLKKHIRKSEHPSSLQIQASSKTVKDGKVNKKQYMTKPIVEPEEHTIQYQPLVYELVQQVLYEDQAQISMRDEAIGYEPSFSLDPNISFYVGNGMNIPGKMKTEANPFASKGPQSSKIGNTLNEPVPFLNNNPIKQNSTYTYNSKINESRLSANQNGSLVIEQGNVSQNNLSFRESQKKT